MTPVPSDSSPEWRRLAAVSSMVDAISPHVQGLAQDRAADLPDWLRGLGVPAGWRIARFDGEGVQPSRIAVCGERARGRWDCCETITVFGFTGTAPVDVVSDAADCTLRDLGAEGITTGILTTPPTPGVVAVRCSGYFTAAGQRLWAQHSAYVEGSRGSGRGRLIEHTVFVELGRWTQRSDDITALSHAIQHAFVTDIAARR